MSPLDYLRAMAKRGRKPATGGIITADQAAPIVEPAGYLMPTAAAEPTDAKPSGYIEISGTVSEADVEQIRQRFQDAVRAEPPRDISWLNAVRTAGACTHDVIYSGCNCTGPNISALTSATDFRADQA